MTKDVEFTGARGQKLAGRLDLPKGSEPRAIALFAHCFSCSKDIAAARVIARALAEQGFGVLRFDFTGLGHSDGDFSDTNFSTNLEDLEAAASWLETNYAAPALLVGHSLGGAAVVAVANRLPSVKGVATIGAPSDTEHVIHQFGTKLDEIEQAGEAEVLLAGRPFKIKQQFIEDVSDSKVIDAVKTLGRPLLVLHSATDEVVGIENASGLFVNAKHPKSFISLGTADHLLSKAKDARYAASMIASWSAGFLSEDTGPAIDAQPGILVSETGIGKFQNSVRVGKHGFVADEPADMGGDDTGPGPYDLLCASLGACTSMTLRMYADRKDWPVGRISVRVNHIKETAPDEPHGKIDIFERVIEFEGPLDDDQRARLLEIADKCPVHRTLEGTVKVKTALN